MEHNRAFANHKKINVGLERMDRSRATISIGEERIVITHP